MVIRNSTLGHTLQGVQVDTWSVKLRLLCSSVDKTEILLIHGERQCVLGPERPRSCRFLIVRLGSC